MAISANLERNVSKPERVRASEVFEHKVFRGWWSKCDSLGGLRYFDCRAELYIRTLSLPVTLRAIFGSRGVVTP